MQFNQGETTMKYETTVNAAGEWAVCEENAGDVIADLMTEDVANKVCDALNRDNKNHDTT
jgi:hypothetical protein